MNEIALPILAYLVGTLLICGGLFYAVWAKLRIAILRQRLFQTRDELWDAARAHDALEAPVYLETRQHLNSAIRMADWWSVSLVSSLPNVNQNLEIEKPDSPIAKDCELALHRATRTIVRYMLFAKGSGYVYMLSVGSQTQIRESLERLLKSNSVVQLRDLRDAIASGAKVRARTRSHRGLTN